MQRIFKSDKREFFMTKDTKEQNERAKELEVVEEHNSENHWKWRMSMVKAIAKCIDPELFGLKGLYVFGSTKNAQAGPMSDIDLIAHVEATDDQIEHLKLWIRGWSLCLSEMNFLKTGYRTDGLIDLHIITDEDIKNQTPFATKITAVSDRARKLPIGKEEGQA